MTLSTFTESLTAIETATDALKALRVEQDCKRITPLQRARCKSAIITLSNELFRTAALLDGK